jgi:hypothetical protein
MHLHGHDFYVLGSGIGNFTVENLNYDNPIRRDTAMLPAGGWLAVAFKTDNPGAWLMHCHVAWHVEQVRYVLPNNVLHHANRDDSFLGNGCAVPGDCEFGVDGLAAFVVSGWV